MPFNELLLKCLIHGTSFTEKITVSVKPQNKETILFFSIDNKNNESCEFNQKFGGGRICDLLVFYRKEYQNKEYDLRIALIEIKGINIKEALEQIINTIEKIKKLKKDNISFKVFIASYRSAPSGWKSKTIKDKFKEMNIDYDDKFNINKKYDIGYFLRR